MDRTLRVLVVILVVLVALGGFFTYTVFSAVRSAGSIHVKVHPKTGGPSFSLPVPAAFVNAAADMATMKNFECDGELEAWRPAIQAAMQEFEKYPDMTFVEVDSYDDYIRISKVANRLVVDVDSDEATVRVSVPPQTVRKFVNAMTSVHVERDRDWNVEVTTNDELDI